mgnify:CR=1 FL=1
MATAEQRESIVAALLALAAERRWDEIALADVAERAGVPLSVLRRAYDGRTAILAEFVAGIDAAVLDGRDLDMDGEPARDRVLDAVMRRLDALAPHKPAIRGLVRSARTQPGLALALARLGLISQPWTLASAGIEASSPMGRLRAAGLGVVMMRILPVWLDDDDPGLSRTLAALDRALTRGEETLDRVERIGCRIRRFVERARSRRARPEERPDGGAAADAGAV